MVGIRDGNCIVQDRATKSMLLHSGRKELDKPPCISMSSIMLLKSLLIVVGYLLKDNKKYLPDYRCERVMGVERKPWTIVHGFWPKLENFDFG